MINLVSIQIPQNIKLTFWEKIVNNKKIINITLLNENKKFIILIENKKKYLKFDLNTNTILINKNQLKTCNKELKKIFEFLKSWNTFVFKKIKFKGKGFRMRFFKKNKFIKFFFGKSHKTFILFKKIIMKKINKYKFTLKGIDKKKLILISSQPVKIRPFNVYTLRGLRLSRQIIYKRKGKKGTYI